MAELTNSSQDQGGGTAASVGGTWLPEPIRRKVWVAAEDLANTIGCTVVEGKTRGYAAPLPAFERRPVVAGPKLGAEVERLIGQRDNLAAQRNRHRSERDEVRQEAQRAEAEVTRLTGKLDDIRRKLAVELNRKPSENAGVPTIDLVVDVVGRWRTAVAHLRGTEADLTEARAVIGRVCAGRDRLLAERDVMAPALVQIQTILKAVDSALAARQPARPRRWEDGDPEPEIGTSVTWGACVGVWKRHGDGTWKSVSCQCEQCSSVAGLTWGDLLAYAPLVEVVATDG